MAVKLKENGKFFNLYIKGAVAYYAKVHSPVLKYQSDDEKEFQVTLFVSAKDAEALEDMALNKTLLEVGKGKNKRKKLAYESDKYPEAEGMFGFKLTRPELRKSGDKNQVIVVGADGKELPPEVLIGNGSKVDVRCFAYKNKDDMLVVQLDLMKVNELVEYEGSGGRIVDDELGVDMERPTQKGSPADEFEQEFDDAPEDDGEDY